MVSAEDVWRFCHCSDCSTVNYCYIAEQLTSASVQTVNKDWEKDFDKMLKPLVERDTPCYILYR